MKKVLAVIAALLVVGGGATAAVLIASQNKGPAIVVTASPPASAYTIEYVPNEKWGGSVQVRWGPELFAQSSDVFNYDLALAAGALSAAATDGEKPNGEYIVDAYTTLGFDEQNITLYSYPDNALSVTKIGNSRKDNKYYIDLWNLIGDNRYNDKGSAFSIASKDMGGWNLLVITMRGTEGRDIFSDANLGSIDFLDVKSHRGFHEFFYDVRLGVEEYLSRHEELVKPNTKILVIGHSFGGAAANLFAAAFNRSDISEPWNNWIDKNNVYAYTFASPLTYSGKSAGTYSNIFNVVNERDNVPLMPEGNGKRFGMDYPPFAEGDSIYKKGDSAGNLTRAFSSGNHAVQLYVAKIKALKDNDPTIIEIESSYDESVRAVEEARVASSRAAEQARVESSRAAQEESRRQAEEESRRQEEEAERRKLETLEGAGIIVMTSTATDFTVSIIDPETGYTNQVRRFVLPSGGTMEYANMDGTQMGNMYPSRYMFDETYRRYAITKYKAGEAGWITENGTFFSVTEKVYAGLGDFSVRQSQRAVGFGVDGYFYYWQSDGSRYNQYKRVPANNVTPSAVEDLPNDYWVIRHLQQTNGKSHPMAPSSATDFLNDKQCIVNLNDRIAICDALPYSEESTYSTGMHLSTQPNLVEIIPSLDGRTSWGGIASPDGKSIAFVSYASGKNELFTVAATGGEPIKVSASLSFSSKNRIDAGQAVLIDWR